MEDRVAERAPCAPFLVVGPETHAGRRRKSDVFALRGALGCLVQRREVVHRIVRAAQCVDRVPVDKVERVARRDNVQLHMAVLMSGARTLSSSCAISATLTLATLPVHARTTCTGRSGVGGARSGAYIERSERGRDMVLCGG